MGDESDRINALLTSRYRDYLRGEYDGGDRARYKLRGRMKDRIRHSILDFALLTDGLSDDDREEIFSPTEYPLGESDGHLYGENEHFTEFVRNYPDDALGSPSEGYIHQRSGVKTDTLEYLDVIEGLHTALGFIYRATDDAEIPFDSFLETAIRRALDMDPRRYEVRVKMAVKLLPPEPDVDTAMEKMQRDQPLTDAEFRILMTEGPFEYDAGDGSHPVVEYYERQQDKESEPIEFTEDDLAEAADALRGFHEMKEIRRKRNQAIKAANAYVDDGGDVNEPLRALKSWILDRNDEIDDSEEANRIGDALDHLEAYVDAGGTMGDSLADMAEWDPERADGQHGSEIEGS